jgi:hypothetical protein
MTVLAGWQPVAKISKFGVVNLISFFCIQLEADPIRHPDWSTTYWPAEEGVRR